MCLRCSHLELTLKPQQVQRNRRGVDEKHRGNKLVETVELIERQAHHDEAADVVKHISWMFSALGKNCDEIVQIVPQLKFAKASHNSTFPCSSLIAALGLALQKNLKCHADAKSTVQRRQHVQLGSGSALCRRGIVRPSKGKPHRN